MILERAEIQETYLNIINAIFSKQTANIKINREKVTAIPPKSGTRQSCPLSPYLFNVILSVLARVIGNKRRSRGYNSEKNSNSHDLLMT